MAAGRLWDLETMFTLLALFILLPTLELALLITIGKHIGVWPTLALIVGTGVIGASLARGQGLSVLRKVQEETAAGRLPHDSIVDGVLILVAGVLLVTPGVLTDFFGFLCLIPGTRSLIKKYFVRRFRRAVQDGRVRMTMRFGGDGPFGQSGASRDEGYRRARRGDGGAAPGPGRGRIIDVKPREPELE